MAVLVILMNSTTEANSTIFLLLPDATVAALGFTLARERLLRGFSLLLSHSIRTSPSPFFATLLLCFLVAIAAALSCVCRRHSASNISANLVPTPPFFLVAGNLTVVLAPSWPALSVLSTAVAGAPPPSMFCSAVVARIVDLLHRCFSGPILCSIEFGVSYWCFLCTSNHSFVVLSIQLYALVRSG